MTKTRHFFSYPEHHLYRTNLEKFPRSNYVGVPNSTFSNTHHAVTAKFPSSKSSLSSHPARSDQYTVTTYSSQHHGYPLDKMHLSKEEYHCNKQHRSRQPAIPLFFFPYVHDVYKIDTLVLYPFLPFPTALPENHCIHKSLIVSRFEPCRTKFEIGVRGISHISFIPPPLQKIADRYTGLSRKPEEMQES